jgi:hypothetical protein
MYMRVILSVKMLHSKILDLKSVLARVMIVFNICPKNPTFEFLTFLET